MRPSFLLGLAAVLAGQAFATVNVTVGGQTLAAGDLLNFTPSNQHFVDSANCTAACGNATQVFKNCNTDDTCVCSNSTGIALQGCEQCIFNYAVNQNIRLPDPLMGSQPALAAFVAACAAPPHNATVQALKMSLPAGWDGPEANKLGLGATVVAVATGAILGGGALWIFSNIE